MPFSLRGSVPGELSLDRGVAVPHMREKATALQGERQQGELWVLWSPQLTEPLHGTTSSQLCSLYPHASFP